MAAAEKIKFDPDALTIGDMEDFQEIAGVPLEQALSPRTVYDAKGNPELDERGRPLKQLQVDPVALKALVYIIKRADNPDYTLNDARQVRVSELDLGGDEEDVEAGKDEASA